MSPGSTESDFYENVIDGNKPLPWARSGVVSAETVARATLKAMRRGRREIIPNNRGRLLVWLNRLSPRLVDWMMGRYTRSK